MRSEDRYINLTVSMSNDSGRAVLPAISVEQSELGISKNVSSRHQILAVVDVNGKCSSIIRALDEEDSVVNVEGKQIVSCAARRTASKIAKILFQTSRASIAG